MNSKVNIDNSGEIFMEKLIEIGKFNFTKDRKENTLINILNRISISENSKKFYNSLMKTQR